LSESDIAKLREAYDALRALAAQMRGFAYNETIANRALRLAGFDPKKRERRAIRDRKHDRHDGRH